MTDRPRNPESAPDDDDGDNLDYLDARLRDDFDDDQATAAMPPPSRSTGQSAVAIDHPAPRDRSWTWPVINAIGLVVVVLVNYLANALEFNGQGTGDVVNQNPVPFQPAGWVFSIWGLIYALLLLFVIYGLLPGGRRNVRVRRISPFFLLANIANVVWIVLWHYEQFLASLITILVLLASLLAIYIGLRLRNPVQRSSAPRPPWYLRLIAWVPFSIYLAWICVASLANLMVWLDRSGWDGGPFSYNVWAIVFMAAGAVIAAAFALTTRDILVPLVFAVAYAGIAHQAWGDSTLVSIAAVVFAVVCAGLALLAWILAFDHDTDRNPFSRKATTGDPPPMTHVDDAPAERT
ncbi:MAG: tryptophan-rich sensory protein [Chloroflexia bacterium]|nr:tryptophan-rich sensory protein [Chloroflexia bacterium]